MDGGDGSKDSLRPLLRFEIEREVDAFLPHTWENWFEPIENQ